MLLGGYSIGVFPMSDPLSGRIDWYRPDPRGVLPLDGLRISRTLRRVVESGRFEIRIDHQRTAVVRACAGARGPDNPSWMNPRLLAAYDELAARGFLHSVEAWRDDRLVGGLYGVALGATFFGESMFVRPELGGADSSKVCLVHLVERLRRGGFALLDTQIVTSHLATLGAIQIPAAEFDVRLAAALELHATWDPVESEAGC